MASMVRFMKSVITPVATKACQHAARASINGFLEEVRMMASVAQVYG